jgi:aspartate/methionine/tyrosine aminotransferase
MRLADRMSVLGTESAFAVLAKARALEAQGRRVVHLEIGEPDRPTPQHVVRAAEQALEEGRTRYVPSAGILPLRQAVATHLASAGRLTTSPEQVVITPGGKPVMFFTLLALCQAGDEVIVPDPGFPMYASIAAATGAVPVALPLRQANGFRLDPDELRSLVTPRTRVLVLNSPHNPCGSVLTEQDVQEVAQIALEHDLVVLSDEIYSSLGYDGACPSVLDVEGMPERTVLLDGWSKTFSMTGWRLGYGVFPAELVEPVTRLLVNSVSCVPEFVQAGGIAALEGPWDAVVEMREEYRQRRDLVVERLNGIDGVSCVTPSGAFYAFPDVTGLGLTSDALADDLLVRAGVACLPGTAFGAHGEGFLRLSYATGRDDLETALSAVARHVEDLGRAGA